MAIQKISDAKNWVGEIQFDTWIPSILDSANIEDAFKAFYFGNIEDGSGYDNKDAVGEVGSLYHHLVSISASVSTVNNTLNSHTSATTSVHGINNTADLATKTYADNAVSTHQSDTTAIHGITDTSKLAVFASTSAGRKLSVQASAPTSPTIGDIWFQVTGL